jgi:hypothetical protein
MNRYLKAVFAFISLLATNFVASYVIAGHPFPITGKEWATAVLTTLAGTVAVYQVPNSPTVVVNR